MPTKILIAIMMVVTVVIGEILEMVTVIIAIILLLNHVDTLMEETAIIKTNGLIVPSLI